MTVRASDTTRKSRRVAAGENNYMNPILLFLPSARPFQKWTGTEAPGKRGNCSLISRSQNVAARLANSWMSLPARIFLRLQPTAAPTAAPTASRPAEVSHRITAPALRFPFPPLAISAADKNPNERRVLRDRHTEEGQWGGGT
jgi:hypothetical protein